MWHPKIESHDAPRTASVVPVGFLLTPLAVAETPTWKMGAGDATSRNR